MHKLSGLRLSVPADGWIAAAEQAQMGPGQAEGSCGAASWSLRFESEEPELRHLRPNWLYRSPLPRTKLMSPAPAARFTGILDLDGERIDLAGWRGMVGHNWGSEHAERWIWLHGIDFAEEPGAWIDVAIGRLELAGRMTPWVANGALSLAGKRHRLGGLGHVLTALRAGARRPVHRFLRPDAVRRRRIRGRGAAAPVVVARRLFRGQGVSPICIA